MTVHTVITLLCCYEIEFPMDTFVSKHQHNTCNTKDVSLIPATMCIVACANSPLCTARDE